MNEWTEAKVKEAIPLEIMVLDGGKVYKGTVLGRKMQFAYVYWGPDGTEKWHGEWAWSTVVRCLNNLRPLQA